MDQSSAELRAKAAGISWEKDGDKFLTIVPEGDEENVFEGDTLIEAIDEAEAFLEVQNRSEVFELDYNDRTSMYKVTLKGDGSWEHVKLHKALQAAKKRFLEKAKEQPQTAPKADEPAPTKGKRRRQPQPDPIPEPEQRDVMGEPAPQIRTNPEDRQPEGVVENMKAAREEVLRNPFTGDGFVITRETIETLADGLLNFSTALRQIANGMQK